MGVRRRNKKTKIPLVEKLINKLNVSGHRGKSHSLSSGNNAGKKQKTRNIVIKAFDLINKQTNENPVQVLVTAIENASPYEEVMRVQKGSVSAGRPVDISPVRRIDLALRWFAQGAQQKAFKKSNAVNTLAKEIIAAANKKTDSFAYSKKTELESAAAANR
ncbi:MAG: 30S ribosomal protein S7 [Euryarchaeota archaeon HGW-Euryarchaeota-1]|nr:MAG: 30S ribosomal protein S7 [Euryarchaeota archaeon HGW-Euryarchaeota-1]